MYAIQIVLYVQMIYLIIIIIIQKKKYNRQKPPMFFMYAEKRIHAEDDPIVDRTKRLINDMYDGRLCCRQKTFYSKSLPLIFQVGGRPTANTDD